MRRADLTSGAAFRTALQVLALFALVFTLAGWLLVSSVTQALRGDIVKQVQTETVLLAEIYRESGRDGLISALRDLDAQGTAPDRAAGLFDGSGANLVGPISTLPDLIGVERRDIRRLSAGRIDGRYYVLAQRIEDLTLVVGRDGRPVDVARNRLVLGLVVFGGTMGAVILVLGLWASRASFRRLTAMEAALRWISEGEMTARLPVTGRGDQFDRVSKQMNRNLDRLERLITGMKATASAIAHDLKTPLSHAQIAMHEAADAVENGRDPGPRLDAALAATERLNGVFDTVLRISRIQARPDQSGFAPVALGEVARQALEFLAPLAEEQGQSLTLDAEGAASVPGDAGMISQAAVNLLKNAVIHSGPGSAITVSAGAHHLAVRDTGPGVPGDPDRLTEPFTRADAARSTEGSGLGLALVKAVADHHDATLELRNLHPGFEARLTFPNLKKF